MDCQHIRAAMDTASRYEPMSETTQRHLRSCTDCRDYADELSGLLGLLQSTPRVTVPADFDFRLRARIASAQEKRHNPFSFLEGFWSFSFSWGQTATAMATVALAATLATLYFVRHTPTNNVTTTSTETRIATNAVAPKVVTPSTPSLPVPTSGQDAPSHTTSVAVKNSPTHRFKAEMSNAVLKSRDNAIESVGNNEAIAAGTPIMVQRGGMRREITVQAVTYGAQPAVNRSENTVATNQVIF